jgi:hypothetical protein
LFFFIFFLVLPSRPFFFSPCNSFLHHPPLSSSSFSSILLSSESCIKGLDVLRNECRKRIVCLWLVTGIQDKVIILWRAWCRQQSTVECDVNKMADVT